MKLTPAQRALLLDVHHGDASASTTYQPAKALVAAGLAEWEHGTFDDTLRLTAADQWDCDHIVALCNGGEHRESNLAPALRDKHRAKTAEDVGVKSKTARVRAKHLGIKRSARPMPGSRASKWKRHMDGSVSVRDRSQS